MAQKLFSDKILGLSQSAGIITLGSGSILTIGGQQYTLSANINLTVPALTSMTLYFIYAVVSSGVVSLTQSTNVNSVGPGTSSWKLVGAYYANGVTGSIAFGSFVTIEGPPTSDQFSYTPTIANVTGFATGPNGFIRRQGARASGQAFVTKNGSVGTGATAVTISLGAWAATTSVSPAATETTGYALPYGISPGGASAFDRAYALDTGAGGTISITKIGTGSSVVGTDFSASSQLSAIFDVPISGFTSTPLRDL